MLRLLIYRLSLCALFLGGLSHLSAHECKEVASESITKSSQTPDHNQVFITTSSHSTEMEDIYMEEKEEDDRVSFKKYLLNNHCPVIDISFDTQGFFTHHIADKLLVSKNFTHFPGVRSLCIALGVFRI